MKSFFVLMMAILLTQHNLIAEERQRAFFKASQELPFHLSVGAVLFNDKGEVACHHFTEFYGEKDIYILMRESMENGESILETLERGLKEEFGATATPTAFLGSLSGILPGIRCSFEKTTLYIACQVVDWHPELRDRDDAEATSVIEWHEPNELIAIMQKQGERIHRVDADESEMIRRALSNR